jgi:hypothetical protein
VKQIMPRSVKKKKAQRSRPLPATKKVVVQTARTASIKATPRWGGVVGEKHWELYQGNASSVLRTLPRDEYDCAITSPPYYSQRDYDTPGQLGLEKTIDGYVTSIVEVMEELRGTCPVESI